VRAQQRIYRVGYLNAGTSNPRILQFFRDGLRKLGWVEGQNIVIDYRYAEGRFDTLPELATNGRHTPKAEYPSRNLLRGILGSQRRWCWRSHGGHA
jgi:putative ABC transport system substrate-binding protein